MDWYAIEPLVAADPARALQLAARARIPLVRTFIAQRAAEDAVLRADKGDLSPWAAALGSASDTVRLDLLAGARDGLRGRKSMRKPDGWSAAYAQLAARPRAEVRDHAPVLPGVLGD